METTRFVAQLKLVVTAMARPLMYAGNSSLTSSHVPRRRRNRTVMTNSVYMPLAGHQSGEQ